MDEMFVVLDENEVPLCASDDPWMVGGDPCLINDYPEKFTVFSLEEAKKWMSTSLAVAKKEKLTVIWEIKKWKIVTLAEYMRENSG